MSDDRTRSDPDFALKDALRIANLRIEELEGENEKWLERGKRIALSNLRNPEGCICVFADDGETTVRQCAVHAAQSARIAELEAALREVERMLDGTDHDERLRVIARTALDGKGTIPKESPRDT